MHAWIFYTNDGRKFFYNFTIFYQKNVIKTSSFRENNIRFFYMKI